MGGTKMSGKLAVKGGASIRGGKTFPAEPDSIFYAPKNVKHEFINTGHETMVLIAAFSKSTYSCDR